MILPEIVNEDQTAYIQNRFIGENIRTIADVIQYTSLMNIPGIVLLIDFEKAFDSLSWDYLMNSLNFFNFGTNFQSWIKTIYSDTESAIFNNGFTSHYFKPERGIRQGCPVSPYLFILAVEVMAIAIRKNHSIVGIKVGEHTLKVSQLADDTTMFMSDVNSVAHVIDFFKKFESISGLKLNLDKTTAHCIGSLSIGDIEQNRLKYKLHWSSGDIKTLGLVISNDLQTIYTENYLPRIKSMETLLNIWQSRNLSLKGKIIILKSLALPKILYVLNCMPVMEQVIDTVCDLITKFIWSGRKPKVKHNVIIQNIHNGGLKAPDFVSMVKSSKAIWMKRMMTTKNSKLKAMINVFIKPLSVDNLAQGNLWNDFIMNTQNDFYKQILLYWNELQVVKMEPGSLLNQSLWYNRSIVAKVNIKGKKVRPLLMKNYIRAGILTLKDIVCDNGEFASYTDLCQKYNITTNIMEYLRIINTIPKEWKTAVKMYMGQGKYCETGYSLYTDHTTIPIEKLTSKSLYWIFIGKKYKPFIASTKWEAILEIENNDWKYILSLPYSCSSETGLQSLAYKVIHRIVSCNKWLHEQQVIDSAICNYCNELDDLVHYFFSCTIMREFWRHLETWWNTNHNPKILLSVKYILFGFYHDLDAFKIINYIVLYAKSYVYTVKMRKGLVSSRNFFVSLKNKICVKEHTLHKKGRYEEYKKHWLPIIASI